MEVQLDLSGVNLETLRLYLRPWDASDLEDFYAYAKDPDVGPRAGWEAHSSINVSKRILVMFLREKKTLALEEKQSGRVIGSIGIEEIRISEREDAFSRYLGKEIGYVLSKPYWGQGIMTEAVEEVIRYCFYDLGLDYLYCGHFEENQASKRVIEKTGFVYLKTVDFQDQRGIQHKTLLYYQWNPLRRRPAGY